MRLAFAALAFPSPAAITRLLPSLCGRGAGVRAPAVVGDRQVAAVTLNGSPLTQHANAAAFNAAASGWYNAGGNLSVAKSEA